MRGQLVHLKSGLVTPPGFLSRNVSKSEARQSRRLKVNSHPRKMEQASNVLLFPGNAPQVQHSTYKANFRRLLRIERRRQIAKDRGT